jgi:CHAD domain-containing protein
MLACERHIARPERRKELHRMRIAAKHFRYTMEALAPCYGKRLDPSIRNARRIQTELGEIHDCDVWIHEALPKFLARERKRTAFAEIKPGVEALMRDRRNRRGAIYRAFLRHWRTLRRKKAFERLTEQLRAGFPPSRDHGTVFHIL